MIMRTAVQFAGLGALLGMAVTGWAQGPEAAKRFLQQTMGLDAEQVRQVQAGQPMVKRVDTPDGAEILIYGAIFVKGEPAKFVQTFVNVEKMVDGKNYLAAKRFGNPPKIDELKGLKLDPEDLEELESCEPGDCKVQLGAAAMKAFRTKVNWRAGDAAQQATRLAKELALGGLKAYQSGGNRALGVYLDQDDPVHVEHVFRTVLGRAKDLPRATPEFHKYLLDYPQYRPKDTVDHFNWEVVDFGLKPTFRMNHIIVHQPPRARGNWVVASKQLYATHYFQTALDMWVCVQDTVGGKKGFYLLTLKGSRQEGLTGFKGKLMRPIVLSKTEEAMGKALESLKRRLETGK